MRKTSNGAVAYIGFSQKEFAASSGGGINESRGSDGKESACNARDQFQSPGWEDPLEETMATHYSILPWRIPVDRGAWQVTVHGVTKSQTPLSD